MFIWIWFSTLVVWENNRNRSIIWKLQLTEINEDWMCSGRCYRELTEMRTGQVRHTGESYSCVDHSCCQAAGHLAPSYEDDTIHHTLDTDTLHIIHHVWTHYTAYITYGHYESCATSHKLCIYTKHKTLHIMHCHSSQHTSQSVRACNNCPSHITLSHREPHCLTIPYPEWQHRQGGCLACRSCKVDPSCGWDCRIYTMHEALRGYCPWGWGCASQLDLPSLTPLSVTGCGRLQLGVPH